MTDQQEPPKPIQDEDPGERGEYVEDEEERDKMWEEGETSDGSNDPADS